MSSVQRGAEAGVDELLVDEFRELRSDLGKFKDQLSDGQRPPGDGVAQSEPEPSAGGDVRTAGEPPPCGYCIWRCPHAPAGTGALGG
ncbi:hypothetical protein QF037_005250 [Streptomyces canus]|uniref:hypothetical protein n=1 Tax=Streptomyces canus TaxID=58343 RepID=UPI002788FD76|nr:hypothetical protein [Streptomyces canus]MDQ0600905.1 hypothetical protein [Streptomyces canus]